jgi:hypothetical protein
MRKLYFLLLISLVTIPGFSQTFISMDPDSAVPTQTLNTIVTGQNFMFTTASSPSTWGTLELLYPTMNFHIQANSITVIDDDHLSVNFTIPGNAPPAIYDLNWIISVPPFCTNCVINTLNSAFTVYNCVDTFALITASSATSFCAPGSVQLNATNGLGYTYQWYRYNSAITGATSSSYTSTVSGNYTVPIINADGCWSLSPMVAVHAYGIPAATITPSGPLAFCPGSGVDLVANSGSNFTYQWYKNGTIIPGATSITYHATVAAHFRVNVTRAGLCSKLSQPVATTYLPAPVAVVTPQGSTTFCAGDSVRLDANSGTGFTYQWIRYNSFIPNATGISYYAKLAGPYKVVVTNTYGCTKKSIKTDLTVNCRIFGTAANELIKIYPDPVFSDLNISGIENAEIFIRDLNGREVAVFKNSDGSNLDISMLPDGVYVAVIRSNDKFTSLKFIKMQR